MEEENEDSLDLLLDTLCNAFGGIILITLLIALMSQEASESPETPKNFKTQWMLEQQTISKLDNEIVIEESINANLQSDQQNDVSEKTSSALRDMDKLKQEKESLAERIALLQKKLLSVPANSSNLAVDLQRQLRQLQKMDSENQELTSQLKKRIEQIEAKLSSANRDIASSKRERTQTLRLPKEKGKTGKKYIWVIVKYGNIYPIGHPDTEEIFNIRTLNENAVQFSPIRSKGYNPFANQNEIIQYFRSIDKKKKYLAFQVFSNDPSFKSFNQAKQIATSMGIGYAWEPRINDIVLVKDGGTGAGSEL
ncbi:MAG: hypothetical protein HN531_14010 [Opitutae bacterium]|jgi:hypothetical protein|nr:hypothetical protein [Opitutae bacterium]